MTDSTCNNTVWLRKISFLLIQHMTHVYQTITWIRPTSTEVPCFNRSPQTRRYVTVTLKRVTGGLNYTLFFKSLHRLIYVCQAEKYFGKVLFFLLYDTLIWAYVLGFGQVGMFLMAEMPLFQHTASLSTTVVQSTRYGWRARCPQ